MRVVAVILGIICVFIAAFDSFETIILPRRVVRKVRVTKIFYRVTWTIWAAFARKISAHRRRDYFLSYFGPLSLIMLLALWGAIFIVAFALIQWGTGSALVSDAKVNSFLGYLYFSGTTFVTLGLGDITPLGGMARFLTVLESGVGLGFLALVIGYVPVAYQAFSRREINIALLDARAGSPPNGAELLIRHYKGDNCDELIQFLRDWERWCAELLENHLSYPVLAYYRSIHENQSWLAALATLLDVCTLILVGIEGIPTKPVKFVFALARHAAVDLAQTFGVRPAVAQARSQDAKGVPAKMRFPANLADFSLLYADLQAKGVVFKSGVAETEAHFRDLRGMYEPFLEALSGYFLLYLPELRVSANRIDDWQTSAWDHFLSSSPNTLDRAMRSSD
jgi:hypothetical protein